MFHKRHNSSFMNARSRRNSTEMDSDYVTPNLGNRQKTAMFLKRASCDPNLALGVSDQKSVLPKLK